MSARIGAIEGLPERDRILVENRNLAVYSSELPSELRGLSTWLDDQTRNENYPSSPPGSRLNNARYGPTVQFLFLRSQNSGEPFDVALSEIASWTKSRPSRADGALDPKVALSFSRLSKTLIATGDPLQPLATPDGSASLEVNDFPDEPFWTLNRKGRKSVRFDDWPASWHRPSIRISAIQTMGKYDRIWYYAMEQYSENQASELRNQGRMAKQLELARKMLAAQGEPFSTSAGLALRRWHWRIENRRQAIEELDPKDREVLAKRAKSLLGGPFVPRPQLVGFALVDNEYEHFFGIRWGEISSQPIVRLKSVAQSEAIEYGPTVGYFYAKAVESDSGTEGAIALLKQWADREPPSLHEFLRQQAAGHLDHGIAPTLERWFETKLAWNVTDDFDAFYQAAIKSDDGNRVKLAVRINDFPDERMFSLFQNGVWVGDFNDWPTAWKRTGERHGLG